MCFQRGHLRIYVALYLQNISFAKRCKVKGLRWFYLSSFVYFYYLKFYVFPYFWRGFRQGSNLYLM